LETSWQLVAAWSFSTFHLCSKLPTCMSW